MNRSSADNLQAELVRSRQDHREELGRLTEQVSSLTHELERLTADSAVLRAELAKSVHQKQVVSAEVEAHCTSWLGEAGGDAEAGGGCLSVACCLWQRPHGVTATTRLVRARCLCTVLLYTSQTNTKLDQIRKKLGMSESEAKAFVQVRQHQTRTESQKEEHPYL
mgnify:CR=1 FL=1